MKCARCMNGITKPEMVTIPFQRDDTVVVINQVPADVCDICGEQYLSSEVTERVLQLTDKAHRAGIDLGVMKYAA